MLNAELDVLERELVDARSGPGAQYANVLERVLVACESDPRAAGYFDVLEIHSDLADVYDQLGRVDDALLHADVLAAAGWNCSPDPRCRRAEILLRAGRSEEAAPIWDEVARATPDDAWVYNNAGLEYGAVGDHETALGWLTRGLDTAVRSGDPERLVDQLRDLRAQSLKALGRDPDELQTAAPALRAPTPGRDIAWEHRGAGAPPVAWGWFPADEYADALVHWPDLAASEILRDADGLVEHAEYCRRLERRLREASESGVSGIRLVAFRWAEFTRWVEENQPEEDEPRQLRAQFSADLSRDPSRIVPWPRGRNELCWCGSGRKYKKCCAAPGEDGSR